MRFFTQARPVFFWRNKAGLAPFFRDASGNDGSQWILEGIRGGRYHSVDRWTPRDDAYYDAGAYMIQLSGRNTLRMGSDFY